MDINELKDKIAKEAGLTREEVDKKIEDKVFELSELVSEEGAAYIVAKEEGLDLLEKRERSLKIKNIIPNLRNVEVIGKIVELSEVREFERNDKKGQVRNITIGDETGRIRIVFWNNMVDLTENLNEGDVVKVKQGFTKANTFGMPEIHLSARSTIEPEEKEIEVAEKSERYSEVSVSKNMGERKNLKEVADNDFLEAKAAIVSLSEREYITCPDCNSKLEEINGSCVCKDHGKVEPKRNLIIHGYLDDGLATLRFVSFKETAERIKNENLIGREKLFTGRIKKNEYFGNLELMVNKIEDIDLDEEIEKLK
ncbi:MAG: hypothetical protein KAT28_02875 [Candidatus Aenigmarchaeota archaeon]|nr:hypothetical protein [Candidatus Aenigmarchaeota archaeon]